MNNIRIFFFTLLLVSISNVTFAQNKDKSWTFTAGVNAVDIRVPSDFTNIVKDYLNGSIEDLNYYGVPIQITAEKYINNGFSVQLSGSFNNVKRGLHKIPNGSDHNFLMVDARIKYALATLFEKEFKWFDPYVGIGPGYSSIGDYESGNDFKIGAGGGLNIWLSDDIGVSLDSYYHHGFKKLSDDNSPTGTDFFKHAISITYRPFGTDSDGDKVKDKNDKCPNTFGLAEYDGCPPPDLDNDGVIDSEDKCPNQAGPFHTDGCPWIDTDDDGIIDKEDDCPNKYGTRANKGCPEDKETEETDNSVTDILKDEAEAFPNVTIHFDLDSHELDKNKMVKLNNAIYHMKKSGLNLLIEGYTDSGAPSIYNQVLSNKRVKSVKDFLISQGIDANLLKEVGYGEQQNSGNSDEKTSNNRIVRISIIK